MNSLLESLKEKQDVWFLETCIFLVQQMADFNFYFM